MPENLYLAWRRGAGNRFRALASRFLLDREYFDPLAAGDNVLSGEHAYSHVNALSSAMQAFLVDGSAKHLRAAKNGFDFVVAQSFATGGWGPNEGFVVPGSGALGDSLNSTHASFETPCGAYGHFKIARYLLTVTGDSRYGDSMERVLYNTVLGALPLKPDGTAFYYADYNAKGSKTYFEYRCPCCSGTIGQVVADYGISCYFLDSRGVFVNLYAPSELRCMIDGSAVTLRQTTAYPLAPEIGIEVGTTTPQTFSVSLRIPAWAGPGTTLTVNDHRWDGEVEPGQFLEIRRTWQGADRIALVLDMPLRLEAVDDKHPNDLAVMQGPLALFAVGDRFLPFTRRDLSALRQTAPQSSEWRVATDDGEQVFKPYFAVEREIHEAVSAGLGLERAGSPELVVEHGTGDHDDGAQDHVHRVPAGARRRLFLWRCAVEGELDRLGVGRLGHQADRDHQDRRDHQQDLAVIEPVDVPQIEDQAELGLDRRDRGIVLVERDGAVEQLVLEPVHERIVVAHDRCRRRAGQSRRSRPP